jgi:thymidylate synthase (FAD)
MSVMARDEFKHYHWMLEQGVAREIARINLPLNTYTEWVWKMDLHNLFHFLKLRMDQHAQWEIRQYAKAIYELIKPIVPMACDAFEDYILNAKTFSKQEMDILKKFLSSNLIESLDSLCKDMGKTEKKEFLEKITVDNL